jgi:hypothetical protein
MLHKQAQLDHYFDTGRTDKARQRTRQITNLDHKFRSPIQIPDFTSRDFCDLSIIRSNPNLIIAAR